MNFNITFENIYALIGALKDEFEFFIDALINVFL